MQNIEIREQLKKKNIKHWELAEKLKISESTLCKRLRKELSEEEKRRVIEAINEMNRGE